MKIKETMQMNIEDIERTHNSGYKDFEFFRRNVIPIGAAEQCTVAVYEIPPKKSAFPYHYHLKNEETFYIISGNGILKTPKGERTVRAGDFLFFPANENGAHRLTNASETEMLVYIDFDTMNDLEVAIYPDSDKVGIFGKGVKQLFKVDSAVDYYEGET